MKNRRSISFIEDVVEEAFGEVNAKNLEIANSLFSYIVNEIKSENESLGYFLPSLGWIIESYALLKNLSYTGSKKDSLISKLGDMQEVSDSIGGISPNKRYPLLFRQISKLKKHFILPNPTEKVHPLFYIALEELQNKNYKKSKIE